MKKIAGDWFAGIFALVLIYMLVKPSSPAAQAVQTISQALISLVSSVTSAS